MILALSLASLVALATAEKYISGGDRATYSNGVVSLQAFKSDEWEGDASWKHVCGGVLINENWVLTTAYCIRDLKYFGAQRAVIGTSDVCSSDGERIRLKRMIPHPEFNNTANSAWKDLAVIELKSASKAKPACLNYRSNYEQQECTALGWGKTHENTDFSQYLLKVDLDTLTYVQCVNAFRNMAGVRIHETLQVCAARLGENDKGICQGDVGGPLVCQAENGDSEVTGIATSGGECGSKQHPGIFLRLAHFITWIQETIADEQLFRFCPNFSKLDDC